VLDPDVVRREDTGSGIIVEVRRAENVARGAIAISRLGLVVRPALINAAAGWVSLLDGQMFTVGALTVQNGRIATIDILRDPARSPASTSPSSTPGGDGLKGHHCDGQPAWSTAARRVLLLSPRPE
jgi:hypothetical protein